MDKRFETFRKPLTVATLSAVGMLGLSACQPEDDPSAYTCKTERIEAEHGDSKSTLATQALENTGTSNPTEERIQEVIKESNFYTGSAYNPISAGKEYTFFVCD